MKYPFTLIQMDKKYKDKFGKNMTILEKPFYKIFVELMNLSYELGATDERNKIDDSSSL